MTEEINIILTDIVEMGSLYYWAHVQVLERDQDDNIIKARVIDLDTRTRFIITPETVAAGMLLVLAETFQVAPEIRESIQQMDIDQVAGDVIIQAALYGTIIYS